MPENGFSVILAADVMYKKFLPPLLFGTMKQLLQPNGAALLVHLVRAGVTQEIVHRAAVDEGFEVTVLSFPMDLLPHHHCSLEESEGAIVYLLRHASTGKRPEGTAEGADEGGVGAQAGG